MSLNQEIHRKIQDLPGGVAESKYDIIWVPPHMLGELWSKATQYLLQGMVVNPKLTVRDVVDGLLDQSIQLWVVARGKEVFACFLTSIERDQGEWVVMLHNLGGRKPKAWVMACDKAMHAFAKSEGATRVRLAGRYGWQRILPGYAVVGSKDGHLIYERAVQ